MAVHLALRGRILILFSLFTYAGVLETIESYKGFRYEYQFRSLPLQKEGKGSGYTNLLLGREEREEKLFLPSGSKRFLYKGAGDWEYTLGKNGWEKRVRSENSDITKILALLLSDNPESGETIFRPNLVFLGSWRNEKAQGKIRYHKGKITEIFAFDSSAQVAFRIKLSRHNEMREIRIPFLPKLRVTFSFPKDRKFLEIIKKRLSCLKVNYDLKRKGKKGILTLEEELPERILKLLFSSGKFALYRDSLFLLSGEALKLLPVSGEIILSLPPDTKLEGEGNFFLESEEKISFPLVLDQREKDGKIKTWKLELKGKERDLFLNVWQEKLSEGIKYEVKR
ncbi:MAG: hypothetical protein ABIK97_03150 [candidate division WOR-3 bacterium]